MTAEEMELFVESVDPDWKDHFLMVETAYEFYERLEQQLQWANIDADEPAIRGFCNGINE